MTLRSLTFVTFKPPHKSYLGDKRGKAVVEEAKQDNAFSKTEKMWLSLTGGSCRGLMKV